nr:hypothetical protein [Tanacetum cinerariifolium]
MVKLSTSFILKLSGLCGLMGGSVPLLSPRFTSKDEKLGGVYTSNDWRTSGELCGLEFSASYRDLMFQLLFVPGLKPKVLSLIKGGLGKIVQAYLTHSNFGETNLGVRKDAFSVRAFENLSPLRGLKSSMLGDQFYGEGLYEKELSKETSSEILPCGDKSCWKTFKPVATLIMKEKLK